MRDPRTWLCSARRGQPTKPADRPVPLKGGGRTSKGGTTAQADGVSRKGACWGIGLGMAKGLIIGSSDAPVEGQGEGGSSSFGGARADRAGYIAPLSRYSRGGRPRSTCPRGTRASHGRERGFDGPGSKPWLPCRSHSGASLRAASGFSRPERLEADHGGEKRMNVEKLEATARALVAPGKGILAADESHPSIGRRFDAAGHPEHRGDPPPLPPDAPHHPGRGGVRERGHPLRRDDPPEGGRRDAAGRGPRRARGSFRASRSTGARSRSRARPGSR